MNSLARRCPGRFGMSVRAIDRRTLIFSALVFASFIVIVERALRVPVRTDIAQPTVSVSKELLRSFSQGRGKNWTAFSLLARVFGDAYRQHRWTEVKEIAETMFLWLRRRSVRDLTERWKNGRDVGIVIAVADRFVPMARLCIRSLDIVGSKLPILITYAKHELSERNQQLLRALPRVELKALDGFSLHILKGFAVKVFSLLESPFRRTILVDADVVFLHSPDSMWEDYKPLRDTGLLLFRDITRPLNDGNRNQTTDFISSMMNVQSTSVAWRQTRLHAGTSQHEVESGVVFVDKTMHVTGLLVIAAMNDGFWRKQFWGMMHGDKESFVMGMEMAGDAYHLTPFGSGIAGASRTRGRVCGYQLAHVDPRVGTRLLWWNHGMAKYKYHAQDLERAQINVWAFDDDFTKRNWDEDWILKKLCVFAPARNFTNAEHDRIVQFAKAWDEFIVGAEAADFHDDFEQRCNAAST